MFFKGFISAPETPKKLLLKFVSGIMFIFCAFPCLFKGVGVDCPLQNMFRSTDFGRF
jgi:hypothetical protein